MNNHSQIIQMLSVYDDLNETERTLVDTHVATCADCAARLAVYQKMDQALYQLPRLRPEPSLRQDFYTQLESNMTSYKRNKQFRRLPAFAIQIFVVGALILLGVGFWVNLQEQNVSVSAPITEPTQTENDTPFFIVGDYSLAHQTYQPGDTLSVEVIWNELWATGNEQVELLLVDTASEHIAQSDTPLTEGRWTETEVVYELTLPDDIENGRYALHLGVTNQETEERIPFPSESVIIPQLVYVGEESIPTPVREAAAIRLESWSPNSQFLIFREYTETDVRDGYLGTQLMYDVNTGAYCPHPIVEQPGDVKNWLVWLDDQTLLYISARGQLVMQQACDSSTIFPFPKGEMGVRLSFLAQSNDLETMLINNTEGFSLENPMRSSIINLEEIPEDLATFSATFSPDDKLLALVDFEGTIWLVGTETGEVVQTVPWNLPGKLPDPIWLANDLLLARPKWLPEEHALITLAENPDEYAQTGSFLVNADGTTTSLENLFDETIDEDTQQIIAAPDLEQGSYTILLYTDPERGKSAPIRVYHSATDEVETLQQEEIWGGGITGNGRYLLLSQSYAEGSAILDNMLAEDDEPIDLSAMNLEMGKLHMIREVTAVHEEPTIFMLTHNGEFISPIWSPNYEKYAQLNSPGFLLQTNSFPNFENFQFWNHELGYAVVENALWAPDQQHIAAVGGMSGIMKSGLFILDTNEFEFLILE